MLSVTKVGADEPTLDVGQSLEISGATLSIKVLCSVAFRALKDPDDESDSSFVVTPGIWTPTLRGHTLAPPAFRSASRACMMISGRNERLLSALPLHVVWEVLSFCRRDWFDRELSEIESLTRALKLESAARKAAEDRCARLEMERDQAMSLCLVMRRRLIQLQAEANGLVTDDGDQESEQDSDGGASDSSG